MVTDIKVGDYITTARYHERMRVLKLCRGSWSLKPMLECQYSAHQTVSVYTEDVINHYPKKF
jgi:hypothetical protein